jgi:hypothetical protein
MRPSLEVSQPRLTNNALFTGTCGVLLFGPLTFGAVEPWSVFVLETCSVLLFALWAYRQWINRQIDVSDQPLYRPMAAFFVAGAAATVDWNYRLPSGDVLAFVALRGLRNARVRGHANASPIFTI